MNDYEMWVTPEGVRCWLVAVADPGPGADDDEGWEPWYPEGPGQRPPQSYEMRQIGWDQVVYEFTVFPYEPWSPYDAAYDHLTAAGWKVRRR